MPIIHFLNVNEGDCSIIQHYSGHTTVIDVCNARPIGSLTESMEKLQKMAAATEKGVYGNYNQKKYPVNPILYMQEHGLSDVFRFILTHPDMDHMDGIKAFFVAFPPTNFWDTENAEEKTFGNGANGGFDEKDWKFYKTLRDGKPETNPKRLTLHSGASGQYYNQGESAGSSGDGLHILAPTKDLVLGADECGDYNDCSYVILYRTGNKKILFAGDSHDETWEHILANHKASVTDVDLLIAPHHGRHSDRDWKFLDVLNPSLTLFGNASSKHLAYSAWNNRDLPFITNNQAGSILVDAESAAMNVYVACKTFAQASNDKTYYSDKFKAYHWGTVKRQQTVAA